MAKLLIKKTDPVVDTKVILKGKTPADKQADIRDTLSYFAGRGLTGLIDEEARKQYATLVGQVGREKAQNLANSVFLFNQRPEVLKQSPEQRVQSYYSIGSANPEVQNTLNRVKSLGYGVGAGFQNSGLLGNMILTGREVAGNDDLPENKASRNVKLLIKNIQK